MTAGSGSRTGYQTATAELPVPQQTKIIAFISTSDNQGTELLSGLAAAIAAGNRKVKVLHADSDFEAENGRLEGDIELLQADYLLVDLPFRPTPFARSVLSDCDLVIVPSSCKIDFLSEAENIVKVLLFLGIEPERVAGVLVDPEGILSRQSLADIKPYLESSLGIEMAGVVSFGSISESQPDKDIERLFQYIK